MTSEGIRTAERYRSTKGGVSKHGTCIAPCAEAILGSIAATYRSSPDRRISLVVDRRALEFVSGRCAVRIHVESVRRADRTGRIRECCDSASFVVGGDGADLTNAFEVDVVGGARRSRDGDLDVGIAAGVTAQPDVPADAGAVRIRNVAVGAVGLIEPHEIDLPLIRRRRWRSNHAGGGGADCDHAANVAISVVPATAETARKVEALRAAIFRSPKVQNKLLYRCSMCAAQCQGCCEKLHIDVEKRASPQRNQRC
jgi:hypothetical protein